MRQARASYEDGRLVLPEIDYDQAYRFRFRSEAHDAGQKTVMGHVFEAGGGQEEGVELIRMLARHPSTARHIATQLATRFVADEPPAALVDHLADVFLATEGDLREVTRALFKQVCVVAAGVVHVGDGLPGLHAEVLIHVDGPAPGVLRHLGFRSRRIQQRGAIQRNRLRLRPRCWCRFRGLARRASAGPNGNAHRDEQDQRARAVPMVRRIENSAHGVSLRKLVCNT